MSEDIARGAIGATLAGLVPAPAALVRRFGELPTHAQQLAAPDAARCEQCGEPLVYCGHSHA